MDAALETHGLIKRFGGIVPTKDVTFRLEQGARHALIGPNGAGKTTFVNLLTGVLAPSAGRVVLLPTAIGALLIAIFSLDLGLALLGLPAANATVALEPSVFFARPIAWHVAVGLGLLAVAGGLMIVPSFAAIQTWAPPARRARVVAAVNVLNAALMGGGALVVALLQRAGLEVPVLFLGIAAVGLGAAAVVFDRSADS